MDTRVLIVGAGPTGLMLANQLGRRGIQPLLIDRHSGPAQQTRAMGVQARTLEIYAKLGIAQRALELGTRAHGANMWTQAQRRARIPVGDIGKSLSPFPFLLMLGQDDNERIMGERLKDCGVGVQWNTELIAIEQHTDYVVATVKQPDGTLRNVAAEWVAGCDGARSGVRDLCHIEFVGAPYEQVFFVADTVASGDMVPDELNVYLWKKGFHLFFPMRGQDRWRVIGMLPEPLRERPDVGFDDVIDHVREAAGGRLTFRDCLWFSTYSIHHRSAGHFREGRCFVLGDAAHVHSPLGAQGMNTGLQDAYNLAWKLALVVSGEANEALLDTYEAERRPVAERLLRTTDRAFMLIVADTPLAALFRTRIMARMAAIAMRRERIRQLVFRTISQIGIRYRMSPLSRTLEGVPEGAPQAGDRFPWLQLRLRQDGPVEDLFEALDDQQFNLLLIGQPEKAEAPRSVGKLVRTYRVPAGADQTALADAHIPVPSFYLLRPDGHVGLAGTRLEPGAIIRYLDENHIRPRSVRAVPIHAV
jgi:2-polyprenyl-6-methoxyphenol hydroxylase-like FAD-dependent oxidoreductase